MITLNLTEAQAFLVAYALNHGAHDDSNSAHQMRRDEEHAAMLADARNARTQWLLACSLFAQLAMPGEASEMLEHIRVLNTSFEIE